MQPDNEIVPENNTDFTPTTEMPLTPPITPPAPLNPTPSTDGFSQPPVSTQTEPVTFQPPTPDVQPQSVQTPPPIIEQPKPTSLMGKIKSLFSKK